MSKSLCIMPIDEINIDLDNRRGTNQETVDGIAKSIEKIGLINPITITDTKMLIAGLHRLEAYKKLNLEKIPCKIITIDGLDKRILKIIELDENLMRYDGHFIEKADLLLERKELYEELYPETKQGQAQAIGMNKKLGYNVEVKSTSTFSQDTAQKLGVSKSTIKQAIQLAKNLQPEVKEYIKEKDIGKKDALLIAREKKETQQQILEEFQTGAKTIKSAISRIKRKDQEENQKKLLEESFDIKENIICGSIENILDYLQPDSVDLILTDPPYPKEYLPLWQVLFDSANQLLKKGGFLVAYAPHIYLPEIFQMKNNLKYVWTIAQIHNGSKTAYHPSKVNVGWKPLLVFVKGSVPDITYYDDVLQGAGREKELHTWQQAEKESEELIKTFSYPNALVLDPFLGSGTTVIAAKNTSRRFFGMDIDQVAIQTTLRRVQEWEQ